MIRLLGTVGVLDEANTPVGLGGRTPAAVVAFLTLARGRLVTVDGLIEQVWDDPPESARNAVQVAVTKLRRSLGPDLISGGRDGYRLRTDLVAVDLFDAERLAAQARTALSSGLPAAAAEDCGTALELFTGDPLAGVDSPGAVAARQSAVDLRTALALMRGEALLDLGRPGEAIPGLREEVEAQPYGETGHALLMDALLAEGRAVEALEVHNRLKSRLVDELGLDPSPTVTETFHRILANEPRHRTGGGSAGAPAAGVGLLHARPIPVPATPLVGREEEIALVVRLLSQGHRLIAITGPGGMGKTRLALGIAEVVARQAGRPVVFVDLRACLTEEQVRQAVGAAVDAREGELEAALESSSAVLVLDNAEQVLDAVSEVVVALLEEPSIAVLVTSQRQLHLKGCRAVPLGPLPGDGPGSVALQLLADRAGLPDEPGDSVVDDLLRLVTLAGGHPLALELIAAALLWSSPHELVEDLAQGMAPLRDEVPGRPERHTTLSAALGWSIGQLSQEARDALGALTVFRGPFDLSGVNAVLGPSLGQSAPRGVLAELLDHSLVQRVPDPGRVAFDLLEPVSWGALSAGLVGQPTAAVRGAHARYHLDRAGDHWQQSRSPDAEMSAIGADLLSAVEWAWAHDRDALTPVMGQILKTWELLGWRTRTIHWGRALLDSSAGTDIERTRVAIALLHALTYHEDANVAELRALAVEIAGHADQLDDRWHSLWIWSQTEISCRAGDLDAAWTWFHRHRPAQPGRAGGRVPQQAVILCLMGRFQDARGVLLAALADPDSGVTENAFLHANVLSLLGYAGIVLGDFDDAADWLGRATNAATSLGDTSPVVLDVEINQAWLSLERGDYVVAIRRAAVLADRAPAIDLLMMRDLATIVGLALAKLGHHQLARESAALAQACAADREDIDPFLRRRLQDVVNATGANPRGGSMPSLAAVTRLLRAATATLDTST